MEYLCLIEGLILSGKLILTNLSSILKIIKRNATFLPFSSDGRFSLEDMTETLLVKL